VKGRNGKGGEVKGKEGKGREGKGSFKRIQSCLYQSNVTTEIPETIYCTK